jgi:triacylglycerol esterase/lipase EstA (alpha/beta hydrolase family)
LPVVSLSGFVALLVGLLAAASLLYVGVSYGMAFLGPATPNTRKAHLLRAMWVELVTTVVLLPLWPFWMVLGSSYAAAVEGEGEALGNRHPVVLLHGLAMNRTNWVWLGRRLAARGIGPLYATTYFSPQSVRYSAQHLKNFVERVLAREDATRVDIVAHSLGGVVARYYIERLGGQRRVARLVTIASPHKGTVLGRLGFVPSAKELTHGSEFLVDLGTPAPDLGGVQYTSIWSRADAIVVPPESASIAPAGVDRIFDDLGHLSLLVSPRVVRAVTERLRA